jgi:hypothetical protein
MEWIVPVAVALACPLGCVALGALVGRTRAERRGGETMGSPPLTRVGAETQDAEPRRCC